jgi:hypothetical protein
MKNAMKTNVKFGCLSAILLAAGWSNAAHALVVMVRRWPQSAPS